MIIRFILISILSVFCTGVIAQDLQYKTFHKKDLMDMARELVTCAAFYAIGARCFAVDKDPSDREHMQKATVEVMRRAEKYSLEADSIPNENIASYKLKFDKMAEKIHEDCQNLEMLVSDHGERCRLLMSEPLIRLKQIEKERTQR